MIKYVSKLIILLATVTEILRINRTSSLSRSCWHNALQITVWVESKPISRLKFPFDPV